MSNFLEYSAPGKLLITGEYLILKGAEGLAVPLNRGQQMSIFIGEREPGLLHWDSYYPSGNWFTGVFSIPEFNIINASDKQFAKRLIEILKAVRSLNPAFMKSGTFKVKTVLDFDPEFGFGSSSTLLVTLAQWAKVDVFELQSLTFKGSGYDVACGLVSKPIVYKLDNNKSVYETVNFSPDFANHIYFAYLGKKRRSMDAIEQFYKSGQFINSDIDAITAITRQVVKTQSLNEFEELLQEHERIISKVLKTTPVRQQLFTQYKSGVVKSLGAWGGDFVLITSPDDPVSFKKKMKEMGFPVVFGFNELIKS